MRMIVMALALLCAGCASEAPQRPVTPPLQPVTGEGQRAIADRAFLFVLIYQFELDGHRYSLGNASDSQQQDTYQELVFIDGQLACARERSMVTVADLDSDLTQWEQVGQPGGLADLADRMRETCRLAAATAPATSSRIDEGPAPAAASESGKVAQHDNSGTDALRDALAATLYTSAGLVGTPLLIVAPLTFLFVASSKLEEAEKTRAAEESAAQWRAATTMEDLMRLLGEPQVEFSLPGVNTRVKAFRLDDVRRYYVGMSDGQPIWFHNEYPWLHELAEQALLQQGTTRKKR